MITRLLRLVLAAGALLLMGNSHAQPLQVGSKRFTESYLLGEIVARLSLQAA
jgi:glycine betaine/choline ABC-type transport system substrate-binding protein